MSPASDAPSPKRGFLLQIQARSPCASLGVVLLWAKFPKIYPLCPTPLSYRIYRLLLLPSAIPSFLSIFTTNPASPSTLPLYRLIYHPLFFLS
uniref:Uncharacterized protein n=1 Tax=Magnetospirillum gryphiswaldense TaxID=55518 RepID=A4U3Q4_9PROT|nr:hypothetical protein MGR_1977 [Magnetospirillum gryphiswaldense MSR-1]